MSRFISVIVMCVFTICAFADFQTTPAPKDSSKRRESVVLAKRKDDQRLRMPSNNPAFQIEGEYGADGYLYIYPEIDSEWRLEISAGGNNNTYYASTSILQNGIFIGIHSEFCIVLTSESGETFIGEFYSE